MPPYQGYSDMSGLDMRTLMQPSGVKPKRKPGPLDMISGFLNDVVTTDNPNGVQRSQFIAPMVPKGMAPQPAAPQYPMKLQYKPSFWDTVHQAFAGGKPNEGIPSGPQMAPLVPRNMQAPVVAQPVKQQAPAVQPMQQQPTTNPLAMVAEDQARAAASPMDMAAQPSLPPFTPSPSDMPPPRPAANALYAGSENWDTAPGWMGRSGGTYSYGAGYPALTPVTRDMPAQAPAKATDAMSVGTRYMMGARPDVNPSAAMLELALPGIDPAVAADKARAGQIRAQTAAMSGVRPQGGGYTPSRADLYRQARSDYAGGETGAGPLVGYGLSGNLTDAQMAAMYPQGQINNPQTAPGYAAPASPLMMIQQPSPTLTSTSARPGMERQVFQPQTAAGRAAVRSANLRSDPDYRVAVERNRAGDSPVTLHIPGESPGQYAGKTAAELAGFGTAEQPGKRDQFRQRTGYDPALRQQYVRARGMGVNPMTLAANDTVMQGGQLTPEQSLAMQGASPEVVANYMGQARQADAMRQGYDASARAAAMEAAAAMEGNVPGSGMAFLDQFMQGQGGQAQAMPDSVPPALLTAVQNAPDDETAARALRFAVENGQITPEKADAMMRARTGNTASTMMNPSPTRPLLPVTSDMFPGGF